MICFMKKIYGLVALFICVTHVNAMTVSSISPDSGIATGNNTIRIIGTGLGNVDVVDIDSNGAYIISVSSTEVVVQVPEGYVWGPVDVSVDDGTVSIIVNGGYTYLEPIISHITPSEGNISGGTNVTIYGSNFTDDINGLYFDGIETFEYTWISSTEISVITPEGAVSGTAISVDIDTNIGTVHGENKFTYIAPSIASVSPNQGTIYGGTLVTIQGTNIPDDIINISFGGDDASTFSWLSSTEVTAITPIQYSAAGGLVDIDIYLSTGEVIHGANQYTYLAPEVSSVMPNSGGIGGGTPVSIYGSNFTNDITDVLFGSYSASSVTWVSPNEITAITPTKTNGIEGVVSVGVVTSSGRTISGTNLFTYIEPIINKVTPDQGPGYGGETITIDGDYFAGITDVIIGGSHAVSFSIDNINTITAVTPYYGVGVTDISLRIGANSYTFPNTYTYFATPSFSAINPDSGDTYGSTPVTITGDNFVTGATVTINGLPLSGIVVTTSSISGLTPALPLGTYDIVITNPDGYAVTAANGFTVIPALAPTLVHITPTTTDARGGGPVTITGTNFVTGATVTINGTALTAATVNNSTTISATLPALVEGTHDLVVTNPDGQTATLSSAFIVTPSPEFLAGDLAPRGLPDGQLNVADLLIMQRFIAELETPTPQEFLAANIAPLSSPDSELNVADFLLLQRAILGDITLGSVIDDEGPQISIVSPANNFYTNSNTVTITGIINEPGAITINDEAAAVDAYFAFSHAITLIEGVNTIHLVATDVYGNSRLQTLTINKDTKTPVVIDVSRLTISESAGQVTVSGAASSVEAGSTVSITANDEIITSIVNSDGSFSAIISATSGDLVKMTVVDNANNNSEQLNYTVGETLQIISPQANATINAGTVNIIGVFVDENNSGINVNGETACTYNNNFYINNLPLTTGDNTLTATYTTSNGGTDSTSIEVSQSGSTSYKLSADKNCGIAPLNVTFELEKGSNVIQQLDVDYDNDGIIDVTSTTPSTVILQHNYSAPGVYPVTVWLTSGTTTQQLSLNIVVNDELAESNALKAIWGDMKTKLLSGNHAGAIQYLTPEGVRAYSGIFTSLMPYMAEFYNEITEIEPISISNEIASFAMLRVEGGETKMYIVNYSKGSDGVWRIHSM